MSKKRLVFRRGRRGSASALIVLLVVLLIFFGVLSLVTAAADNRLARRRAEWISAYYAADRSAVELVGDLSRDKLPADTSVVTQTELLLQLQNYLDSLDYVELLEPLPESDSDLLFRCRTGEQAIEVGLRLIEPSAGSEDYRLDITRWTAWQQPFDYDSDEGGVWKGDIE